MNMQFKNWIIYGHIYFREPEVPEVPNGSAFMLDCTRKQIYKEMDFPIGHNRAQ